MLPVLTHSDASHLREIAFRPTDRPDHQQVDDRLQNEVTSVSKGPENASKAFPIGNQAKLQRNLA